MKTARKHYEVFHYLENHKIELIGKYTNKTKAFMVAKRLLNSSVTIFTQEDPSSQGRIIGGYVKGQPFTL